MKCLLCNSNNIKIIETIAKKDIARLYLNLNIDIHDEIKTPVINKFHCNNCGLVFFDPQNAGGDKFYSRLGENEWYYLHSGKTEYEYVQNLINENDKVLDVGAGRGELFNRTKKKINYTGLELSTKAVELAALSSINVINEDIIIHSENNIEKYDIICLFQVLEHICNLNTFLVSIIKCLKQGGKFCVAVPNNDGFLSFTTNNALNLPPHHSILWNYKSLVSLSQYFDLEIIDVHYEKLQDVHKQWFTLTFILNKLRVLFNRQYKSVNLGISYRLLSRIIGRLLRFKIFEKMIAKIIFSKERKGHSIIITYQKKEKTSE